MKRSATYFVERWDETKKDWIRHSQYNTLAQARRELKRIKPDFRVCIIKWQVIEVIEPDLKCFTVFKLGRISHRRTILAKNLTRDEAERMVKRYTNNARSQVIFSKYL